MEFGGWLHKCLLEKVNSIPAVQTQADCCEIRTSKDKLLNIPESIAKMKN